MTKRILVATYEREEDLLSGARAARTAGLEILDAYTPYAVHGLDDAMGLKPSRLTWVCFALGASAAIFMTWFQHWTSAVSWPVNIGGKPWNSLPAFAPVIFEAMVLCAGLGTVAVLFLVCRLLPGRRAQLVAEGITDDRFALVVEHGGADRDLQEMRQLFQASQPCALEERILDESTGRCCADGNSSPSGWLGPVNLVLLCIFLILAGANVFLPLSPDQTNWEVFPEMMHSPASGSLSDNAVLPAGITLQPPVPGTIARGRLPIHYDVSEESAAAAGRELENPYQPDEQDALDPAVLERGKHVFATACAACHGPNGDGDGMVAQRGFPPPPSFAAGKSNDMADGQLFHILTYGKGNMPPAAVQVSPDDRWKVIHYVRQLQTKAKAKAAAEAAEQAPGEEPVDAQAVTEQAPGEEPVVEEATPAEGTSEEASGDPKS